MARPGIRRKPQSAAEKARKRLVRILLKECDSPARALELDYWSKEPGLLEIIRGIVMMPEDARATIEAFLLLARNTSSVSAGLDQRGVLTLASVQVARSVALAQYAAAEDELDADLVRMGAPRLLN
jgi:hypothetical protein